MYANQNIYKDIEKFNLEGRFTKKFINVIVLLQNKKIGANIMDKTLFLIK